MKTEVYLNPELLEVSSSLLIWLNYRDSCFHSSQGQSSLLHLHTSGPALAPTKLPI